MASENFLFFFYATIYIYLGFEQSNWLFKKTTKTPKLNNQHKSSFDNQMHMHIITTVMTKKSQSHKYDPLICWSTGLKKHHKPQTLQIPYC